MIKHVRTTVLKASDPSALERAAAVLLEGGLVAYPTDTLYGLGADGLRPTAVERVFQVKGRVPEKGIPLLLGGIQDVDLVAEDIPEAAWKLAECFWPGGLTLVLRRRPVVPDIVTAAGPTVAVRVPDHPVPLALIKLIAAPLTGTSANRSGESSPTSAKEVEKSLGGLIDILLDGGPTHGGVESTVVDLSSGQPVVLRAGAVSVADLRRVLGQPIR